ncbi:acyl-CoA N-acyltransferase [Anopheles sinensis]|uniref:Acyl-CoA N-acyltransferase n=1 Tax=Anopheles sinensis TaxID=74873 RepID=A0A084VU37_ANOSI|nr:acyl-CoA N-acyltransferase [Anopheles sinensis]
MAIWNILVSSSTSAYDELESFRKSASKRSHFLPSSLAHAATVFAVLLLRVQGKSGNKTRQKCCCHFRERDAKILVDQNASKIVPKPGSCR